MTNKYDEAISCIKRAKTHFQEFAISKSKQHQDDKNFDLAVEALEQAKRRENPEPLTLEQFKQIIGKPVYHVMFGSKCGTGWVIVDDGYAPDDEYGITWVAYTHEPLDRPARTI